ncbi:MAG: hypothetical protein EXS49_01950 [Candidatus Pacebacteria bacterium]|nr:hypothetical protein [Candidatus Paceibacterota bacterium]
MKIKFVKKNTGFKQKFDIEKLKGSIAAALKDADIFDSGFASKIAQDILHRLEKRENEMVKVEDIRQCAMQSIKDLGLSRVLDTYEVISLRLPHLKINQVQKKTGETEPYHPLKIFKSIKKSFRDAGINGVSKIAEDLTKEITKKLEEIYAGRPVPSEEIKKNTAEFLKNHGYEKVERFYLMNRYI